MCGILGWFGRADRASPAGFARALELLRHRGPDDNGVYTGTVGDGSSLLLGHCRLSILDLSQSGHQPMISSRTGSVIVYNGEIYNFPELRETLQAKGYGFRSHCDTEVLLAAYDEWGIEAVPRLNGIFAFAIYDPRRDTLLLARDHLGVKPLYYHESEGMFAFGSELTALVAAVGQPLYVRPEAVQEFFAFGYLAKDQTPLRRYFKLLPAHALEYDLAKRAFRVWPYWNLLDHLTAPEFTDDEDTLAERLEDLLLDAVKRQLMSDVPLGAFLSGGIDSTLVSALLTRVADRKPKTYSIGFTVPAWDEAPWAKKIAAHLGTEHHEHYISPEGLQDTIPEVACLYDEPFGDSSAIPTTVLCQMVKRHVTVALSGDGGDELYFGYRRYPRAVQYQQFQRLPLPLRWAGQRLLKALPHRRWQRWGAALASPTLADFYIFQTEWPQRHRLFPQRQPLVWEQVAKNMDAALGPSRWAKFMPAMDLSTYLPEDILAKVDRASMSVSLEVRVPLLDYRLVEFAARVPQCMKYRSGVTKYLLRKILAKYVPPALWDRPKSGFAIPLGKWFRNELRTWVQDELTSDWGWTLDIIDRRGASEIIRQHMAGEQNNAACLWALISWKTWCRRIGLLS